MKQPVVVANRTAVFIIGAVLFFLLPATTSAGFEHLALMYGILPPDIALAGARGDGAAEVATAYHNPAALADLASTSLAIHMASPISRAG
jgi:hypothetical protein